MRMHDFERILIENQYGMHFDLVGIACDRPSAITNRTRRVEDRQFRRTRTAHASPVRRDALKHIELCLHLLQKTGTSTRLHSTAIVFVSG